LNDLKQDLYVDMKNSETYMDASLCDVSASELECESDMLTREGWLCVA